MFFFKRIFGKKWGSSSNVKFERKGEIGGKEAVCQQTASSAARCANIGGLRTAVSSLEIGGSLYNDVNGTNQEKRGAKEAYMKVKVEVTALEAEVEELKDVLQVLKASKADKEALEGGDINSILFASAGLGGGGSRGGAGLSKSSVSGVDSGGNPASVYLPVHAWDRCFVKTRGPKTNHCRVEKEISENSG